MCFEQPYQWKALLSLAEWWYNTSYHTALKMLPFQALHGYYQPQLALPGTATNVAAVDYWTKERRGWNKLLKANLRKAHNQMQQNSGKPRSERKFVEGYFVDLKLQP